MARNYARRASDGRRAASKRGMPTLVYTDGAAAMRLVKNELPKPKLVEKPLALIPGVLVVGEFNPLLGTFSVEHYGAYKRMTREQVNTELMLKEFRRLMPTKKETVKAEAVTVPLLSAVCLTTKRIAPQTLAAAA